VNGKGMPVALIFPLKVALPQFAHCFAAVDSSFLPQFNCGRNDE